MVIETRNWDSPCGCGDAATTTVANINEYTDDMAESGKQYHYRVKAVAGALESPYCEEEAVSVPPLVIDLDVDSDNNDSFGIPEGSLEEDALEEDSSAGKYIVATIADADNDGVVDFADYKVQGLREEKGSERDSVTANAL